MTGHVMVIYIYIFRHADSRGLQVIITNTVEFLGSNLLQELICGSIFATENNEKERVWQLLKLTDLIANNIF